eukprot:gene12309-14438_t
MTVSSLYASGGNAGHGVGGGLLGGGGGGQTPPSFEQYRLYQQQQQQQLPHGLAEPLNADMDYIPTTSIYEKPLPQSIDTLGHQTQRRPMMPYQAAQSVYNPSGSLMSSQQSTDMRGPMVGGAVSTTYYKSPEDNQLFADKFDKRWLTIFGFPLAQSEQILNGLLGDVTIVETKYPQGNTNWMHIKLETEAIASDLLCKNGMIIANYMIGIVPCKDMTKSGPLPLPSTQTPYQEIESYIPSKKEYDPLEYCNPNDSYKWLGQ